MQTFVDLLNRTKKEHVKKSLPNSKLTITNKDFRDKNCEYQAQTKVTYLYRLELCKKKLGDACLQARGFFTRKGNFVDVHFVHTDTPPPPPDKACIIRI
jgi:hypothetical protein